MADLEFSRQEFEALAEKLTELGPHLSERETTLLTAIFAAAADRVTTVGLGGGTTLPGFEIRNPQDEAGREREAAFPELQRRLLNAYIPGNISGSTIVCKVFGSPPIGPSPHQPGGGE